MRGIHVRRARVRSRVLAVALRDLRALLHGPAALVQVPPHLQPRDRERRDAQRAVQTPDRARSARSCRARPRPTPSNAPPPPRCWRCPTGSASPPSRSRTARPRPPSGPAAARRPADRARTRRRCWCPPRSPRRHRRRSPRPCGGRCRRPRRRTGRPRTSAPCRRRRAWWGRSRTSRRRPPRLATPSPRVIPCPRGRRGVDAVARGHRAGQHHALHARPRDRDLRRAGRPLGGRHRVVLGRRGPRPGDLVPHSLRPGPGHVARRGVGHLVRGGNHEPGAPVRGRLGRPDARGGGGRLGGRGRRGPPRHLPRAPRADRSPGARSPIAGRGAARHGGHLHAHGDRDGGRGHGVLEDRRDLGAHLQRLRRRGCGRAPVRREREGPDHGRRLAPARPRRCP